MRKIAPTSAEEDADVIPPDASPEEEAGVSEVEGEGWITTDEVWVDVRKMVESCSEEVSTEVGGDDSVLEGK